MAADNPLSIPSANLPARNTYYKNWSDEKIVVCFLLIAFGWTWILGWSFVANQDMTSVQDNVAIILGLSTFGPTFAAFLVSYLSDGKEGMMILVRRCDPRQIKLHWFQYAMFAMPIIDCVVCALFVWFGGNPPSTNPIKFIINLIISFPRGSLGEEFGWRGVLQPLVLRILDKHFAGVHSNKSQEPINPIRYSINPIDPVRYSSQNGDNVKSSAASSGLDESKHEQANHMWRYSSLVSIVIVGAFWAVWHLPAFYAKALRQNHCNFGQFFIQEILYSGFYLWQANNNNHNIILALLMHSSVNCWGGLVSWGDVSFPSFTAMPNAMYTIVLLVFFTSIILNVGVELERKTQ